MEAEEFAEVPENVRSIIEHVGLLGELADENSEHIYQRLRDGRCMTCCAQLGTDTILLITRNGIVAAYCGGACMQDMAIVGWIQEQHDDIQDAIRFRGGEGDSPDEL